MVRTAARRSSTTAASSLVFSRRRISTRPRPLDAAGGTAMSDTDPAKAAADLEKAQADAALAKANAEKAAADARAAEAAAEKAQAETDEYKSSLARQQRDAEARKAIDVAGKDAAAARSQQIGSLLPDLSKVEKSTLEDKDGPPGYATPLTFAALAQVGTAVAAKLVGQLGENATPRILVSSVSDLASGDAVYQDVTTGLKELIDGATALMSTLFPASGFKAGEGFAKPLGEDFSMATAVPLLDVVAGVASAVPGVLSLSSVRKERSAVRPRR
jgi:hypothetical protein